MHGNILHCYPVTLPWQVMLHSGYVISHRVARAACNRVIKRDKTHGLFHSKVRQGTAKLIKSYSENSN